MATDVDICNLALTHIGAFPMTSLSEATPEAGYCNRLYPVARDTVLREHAWNFAAKTVALATVTDTHPRYDYVYALPADCLVARKIINTLSDAKIDFEIFRNADDSAQRIATDQAEAELAYTAKTTNTLFFNPEFIDALSWRLAADLAMPIRGDLNAQQSAMNMYFSIIMKAQAVDANEGSKGPSTTCAFLDARL